MARRKKKKILVLGVGNILLGDEGAGVRAVEFFEKAYAFPENVACVDGGTGGAKLLPLISGFTHIIIVDAVRSGKPPGSIVRMSGRDLPAGKKFLPRSTHELALGEVLALSSFEGFTPFVTLIGIEPESIAPGVELSKAVEKRLPEVSGLIKGEVRKFGINLKEKTHLKP